MPHIIILKEEDYMNEKCNFCDEQIEVLSFYYDNDKFSKPINCTRKEYAKILEYLHLTDSEIITFQSNKGRYISILILSIVDVEYGFKEKQDDEIYTLYNV
jgi:hypothetical protein